MNLKRIVLSITLISTGNIEHLPAAPISTTWETTESEGSINDLNTGFWSDGVPTGGVIAIFDSSYSEGFDSVEVTPSAVTDFTAGAFFFPKSANVFSFVFDGCSLTLDGAGILGTDNSGNPTQTNTTITISNTDNSDYPLVYQLAFSGVSLPDGEITSAYTGSAQFVISNDGTNTENDPDYFSINDISTTEYQLVAGVDLYAGVNANFNITNSGTNSGYGDIIEDLAVGAVVYQALIAPIDPYEPSGSFSADNGLVLTISNAGTDDVSGISSVDNAIGVVEYSQLFIVDTMNVNNSATIAVSNQGNNEGSGADSYIGTVGFLEIIPGDLAPTEEFAPNMIAPFFSQGSQVAIGNVETGDYFSLTVTNEGTDSGTFGAGNTVGSVEGTQLGVELCGIGGNRATFLVTNSADNSGGAVNSYIGDVGAHVIIGEFSVEPDEGNYLSLTATNTATNTGTGNNNYVGDVFEGQFLLGAGFEVGDKAQVLVTNTGSNSNNASYNAVGVIGIPEIVPPVSGVVGSQSINEDIIYSQALFGLSGGPLLTGDYFDINVSNEGVNSGNDYYNEVGYVTGVQLGVFELEIGNKASIVVTNSGDNSGANADNDVGYIGFGQAYFGYIDGNYNGFEEGPNNNGLCMNISNEGTDSSTGSSSNDVGYVDGSQLFVEYYINVGDKATFDIKNKGTDSGESSNSDIGYINGPQMTFDVFGYENDGFYSGAALRMTICNEGESTNTSASANTDVGCVNDQQLLAPYFTVGDRSSIHVSNKGSNQGDSIDGAVGSIFYDQVGMGFFDTEGKYGLADGVSIKISNEGKNGDWDCDYYEEYDYKTSNTYVGVVEGLQLTVDEMSLGNKCTIDVNNYGVNSSAAVDSFIGTVGRDGQAQVIMGGLSAEDCLSVKVSNVGSDDGDGCANQVGVDFGSQLNINELLIGNKATIDVSNCGKNSGSSIDSSIGTIYDGELASQVQIGSLGVYEASNDNFAMTVSNTATDCGQGVDNSIGLLNLGQVYLGETSLGINAQFVVSNEGKNKGSAIDSYIGTVGENQVFLSDLTRAGTGFSMVVSNSGCDDGCDGLDNVIGYVYEGQFVANDAILLGDNASFNVANSGTNSGFNTDSGVGYVNDDQMLFLGNLDTGVNLLISVSNEGYDDNVADDLCYYLDNETGGDRYVGFVNGNQLHFESYGPENLYVNEGAVFNVTNSGSNFSVGTDSSIGYVGGTQVFLENKFFVGSDYFQMTISNSGSDASTGSDNYVGYVEEQQLFSPLGTTLGDRATFTISNQGSNSGSSTDSSIGFALDEAISAQAYFGGEGLSATDRLTMTISNIGEDVGSSEGNSVGCLFGGQLVVEDFFEIGSKATIEVTNSGSNTGSSTDADVGLIHYQAAIEGIFPAIKGNSGLTVRICNSGVDSSIGSSRNRVGYINSSAPVGAQLEAINVCVNDGATFDIKNSGTDSGSTINSSIGYIEGLQVSLEGINVSGFFGTEYETVIPGDELTIKICNEGTGTLDSSSADTAVGYVHYGQFSCESIFVGDKSTVEVSNKGTNQGSSSNSVLGFVNDSQMMNGIFGWEESLLNSPPDGVSLKISNAGNNSGGSFDDLVGYVGGQLFTDVIALGSGADIDVCNSGNNSGSGSGNWVGVVNLLDFLEHGSVVAQLDVGEIVTEDSLSIQVANAGINDSDSSYNYVGDLYGFQIALDGLSTQNQASVIVSNSGTNSGSATDSIVGSIGVVNAGEFTEPITELPQVFIGVFGGSDGLSMVVCNSGEDNSTGINNTVGSVLGGQLALGTVDFDDNASFIVDNKGSKSESVSDSTIGAIFSSQVSFEGVADFGNGFSMAVANVGCDTGSDGVENAIGYVGGQQFVAHDTFFVGDYSTFDVTNSGKNSGFNTDTYVGYVGDDQMLFEGLFGSNDRTTRGLLISVSNEGCDSNLAEDSYYIEETGGDRSVGYVEGNQLHFESYVDVLEIDEKTVFAVANSGSNSSLGTDSSIGYVGGAQILFDNVYVAAGDCFHMTISNEGHDAGIGSDNDVGYVYSTQLNASLGSEMYDQAVLTISNKGCNSGSTVDSYIGVVGGNDSDAQVYFGADFYAHDNLNMTVSNEGNDSGSSSENTVGSIFADQLLINDSIFVGHKATVEVTNSGSNTGSSTDGTVGYVYSQVITPAIGSDEGGNSSFTMTISNTGVDGSSSGNNNYVGYVDGFETSGQLDLTNAYMEDGATFDISNSGTDSGASSDSYIGYVNGLQVVIGEGFNVDYGFNPGNGLSMTISNEGTSTIDSTSADNFVGAINNDQLNVPEFYVGNKSTLDVSNKGYSQGATADSCVGVVFGNQINNMTAFGSADFSAAGVSVRVSNLGNDSGSDTDNLVGVIFDNQLLADEMYFGAKGQIDVCNTGVNSGSAVDNVIGVVGYDSGSQLVAQVVEAGDHFSINIANTGIDSSDGYGSENIVGYTDGLQLNLGTLSVFDRAGVTISNCGTNSGSSFDSYIGVIDEGQLYTSTIEADDLFCLNVANTGIDSSDGSGNLVGYSGLSQVVVGSLLVGTQAHVTVSNSGNNSGSAADSFVGVLGNLGDEFTSYVAASQVSSLGISPNSPDSTDGFSMFVSNSGDDSSDGIDNDVGTVSFRQLDLNTVELGNDVSFLIGNRGSSSGTATDSNIGFIGDTQVYFGGETTFGNALSMTVVNIGCESGLGGTDNSIGIVGGGQVVVDNSLQSGNNATFDVRNYGENRGSGSDFAVGIVNDDQFVFTVNSSFSPRVGLTMNISNEGCDNYHHHHLQGCSKCGNEVADRGVGVVSGNQLLFDFIDNVTFQDGTSLSIANRGTNHTSCSQSGIGVVGGSQYIVQGAVAAKDGFELNVCNEGINDSNGSDNSIGYINGNQFQSNNGFGVGNEASLSFKNKGNNAGFNTNLHIATVGHQAFFDGSEGSFDAGNDLSLMICNEGSNAGIGNSNNVGEVDRQLISTLGFITLNNASIEIFNSGTNEGSGAHNNIGTAVVQANFYGSFSAGDNVSIKICNEGTDVGSSTGSNQVGYIASNQLYSYGVDIGSKGKFNISNEGTNSNLSVDSNVGYVANQIYFDCADHSVALSTGDATSVTVSNTGTNSGVQSNNRVGGVNASQLHSANDAYVANNAVFNIQNEGINSNSSTNSKIGTVFHQAFFDWSGGDSDYSLTAENGLNVTISNAGTDQGTENSSNNYVGYLEGEQFNSYKTIVGNDAVFTITNVGNNDGGSSTDSWIGSIGYDYSIDRDIFAQANVNLVAQDNLQINILNIGVDSGVNSNENAVGYVSGQQLESDSMSVRDNASFNVFNIGANFGSSTDTWIGVIGDYYAANSDPDLKYALHQVGLGYDSSELEFEPGDSNFSAHHDLTMNIVNIGIDDGENGSSNNSVGYLYGSQLLADKMEMGCGATFNAINAGVNIGYSANSWVGAIGAAGDTDQGIYSQVYGNVHADDDFSMLVINGGIDFSQNSAGDNATGYVSGRQLGAECIHVGDNATVYVENIGVNGGVASDSWIGVVGDYYAGLELPQMDVDHLHAGQNFRLNIGNIGTDDLSLLGDQHSAVDRLFGPELQSASTSLGYHSMSDVVDVHSDSSPSSGGSENTVGCVNGSQLRLRHAYLESSSTINVDNLAINTGSSINGWIGNIEGSQVELNEYFNAQDDFSMHVRNHAIAEGCSSNLVGTIRDSQLYTSDECSFSVDDNATITACNDGAVLGNGGSCELRKANEMSCSGVNSDPSDFYSLGAQMEFNGDFSAGANASLIAINSGYVAGPQIYFGAGFEVGPGSSITAINNGPDYTGGVVFTGDTSGGDVLVSLCNSLLNIATYQGSASNLNPFTVAALSGDIYSSVISNQQLIIDNDRGTQLFAGSINVPSMYVDGGGTQVFSGPVTVATTTEIAPYVTLGLDAPGVLTSPTVLIDAGATLAGNGTVVGNVINNGTIALGVVPVMVPCVTEASEAEVASMVKIPLLKASSMQASIFRAPALGGNVINFNTPISVTTYVGNYTQTGTIMATINPAGESTQLLVTGTADLNGLLLIDNTSITNPTQYQLNVPYTILTAELGLGNTQFADTQFESPLDPLLRSFTVYVDNDTVVDLLIKTNFAAYAATGSQAALAKQIDNLVDPSSESVLVDALLSLTPEQIPAALKEMSGNQYAAFVMENEYFDRRFGRRIFDMVRTELDPCSSVLSCGQVDTWADVEIGRQCASSTAEAFGAQTDSVDISVGIHTQVDPCFVVGAAGNFGFAHFHFNQNRHNDLYNGQGALYASYSDPDYYLFSDLVLGYSYSKFKRQVKVGDVSDIAHSKPQTFHGMWYAEGGLNFQACDLLIQPFFGFDVNFIKQFKTTESGAGDFNLVLNDHTISNWYTYLGSHFSYALCNCVAFNLDLAWQHRFGDQPYVSARFADFGNSVSVTANNPGRDSIWGNLNAEVSVRQNIDLYAEIAGEYWDRWAAGSFSVGINCRW